MKINPADWNTLDWILLGILAYSTIRAIMRGLVRAIFGLLGLMGGLQLASWNYVRVGDLLHSRGWFGPVTTARIVAFIVLTVIVVVVFEMVGRGVKKTANAIGLSSIDHVLGGSFGFVRGLLVGVALIIGLRAFSPDSPWLSGSKLSFYFLGAMHTVSFLVPHDFR